MSRIIAGAAGGTVLKSVPGDGTRPTTDRVKESLFSRLESWNVISGARVLDLFAGSGGLGLEMASRGARSVLLVEKAQKAAAVCQQNTGQVNKSVGQVIARAQRGTVNTVLDSMYESSTGLPLKTFDVVLLDPPYPLGEEELALTLEKVARVLETDSTVVIERSSRSPEPTWPAGLEAITHRKFGETTLWFAEPV